MNTDMVENRRSNRGQAVDAYTGSSTSPALAQHSQPQRARFRIDGLSGSNDALRLENRLSRQVGVIGVSVNPINDSAYVAFDPAMTSATLLLRQIEFSGFGARLR